MDFGFDGVLEVLLYYKKGVLVNEDTAYLVQVLYFDNGNLYVDYIPIEGIIRTYDGKAIRRESSDSYTNYIYEIVTVSAENGIQRQAIARRESALYHNKYYISAICENGEYIDAPERECTIEEFEDFVKHIDNGFPKRAIDYTLSNIQEIFLSLK